MKKFIIVVKEMHLAKYEVEARNEAEAKEKYVNGEADACEGDSAEFCRVLEEFGNAGIEQIYPSEE